MRTAFTTGAVAALAFVVPALAQTTTGYTATPGQTGSTPGITDNQQLSTQNQAIATRLRSDLQKAGFTAVQIMPESFLVHAKDSQGHPVMMVINPDSFTEVTALGNTGGDHTGGSNAGSATGTSSMAADAGTGTQGSNPGNHPGSTTTPDTTTSSAQHR